MYEFINPHTNKTVLSIPSTLEELTTVQYCKWLELVLRQLDGEITYVHDMRILWYAYLSNLKWSNKIITYATQVEQEVWENLTLKAELMDSFFHVDKDENGDATYTPNLITGYNKLPKWRGFVGPTDMMDNVTFEQFLKANELHAAIERNPKDESLKIDFFLNLYTHPTGKPFPCRKRDAKIALYHAITLFSSILYLMQHVPIRVRGNLIDFSILWKQTDDSLKKYNLLKDNSGWQGTLYAVAESGAFGTANETNKQYFWDVMLFIYQLQVKSINQQKINDSITKKK